MKTAIHIIGVLALAGTFSFAEGDQKPERKGHNPQKLLEHLDKDGSGTVSKDEFTNSKRGQKNPERAAKAFAAIDADGNGEITTQELAQHKPGRKGKDGGKPNPAKVMERIDKDGSGSISLAEFQATPRAQENPEKAVEIFGKLDADSNGEITKDEFAKHRRKPGQRPGKERQNDGGDELYIE